MLNSPKSNFQNFIQYCTYFFIFCMVFIAGFYFGHRAKTIGTQEEVLRIQTTQSQLDNKSNQSEIVKSLEVPAVHWIKLGTEPVCPETHPIKGKFEKNANLYYLQSNKNFDKVKPEICFTSEEFARDTAGFVRKF